MIVSGRTEQALDAVYEVFSDARKPSEVSGCPCCMVEISPCTLLATPLRELTAETLEVYAANVLLTVGGPDDFRYFLPRLLDISIHDGFDWPDPEVLFEKLHLAEWQLWPEDERLPIQNLLTSVFEDAVASAVGGSGTWDAWEIDTWICAIAATHLPISPFLRRLSEPQFAELRQAIEAKNQPALNKGRLSNSFWSINPSAMAEMLAWLGSDG